MNIKQKRICIIDLNLGNLNSIYNAIKCLEYDAIISNKRKDIIDSEKIILPGNGNFSFAMQQLKKFNLHDLITIEVLNKGKIILGICLGMQIMFDTGFEENQTKGLGFFKGEVKKIQNFNNQKDFSLPHIGWNDVEIKKFDSPLYNNILSESSFYYLNSYVCDAENIDYVSGYTKYSQKFVSSVENKNIFGVQFHPEKSQKNGIILLKNWLEFN
mgnify:CR=1 FL=1|tara:strand:+ start:45 stop:686 length:642 start_codon:yes stop_codon:yes gene_type:complete